MINDQHVLPSYLQKGGALHMEYLCVQDADLLDAIGAVGVARCMAFSGKKNRPLVNPMAGPNFHDDLDAAGNEHPDTDATIPTLFLFLTHIPTHTHCIFTHSTLPFQCTPRSRMWAKTAPSAISSRRYLLWRIPT